MISRSALVPWLRRPLVVAVLAMLLLAALLSGGLVVARAVDGTPTTETTASESPAADQDGGNGDDNVAVAVNRTDGRDAYAVRLKVVITDDATVDAGNAAVAAASCSDCRTVAVALEGVLLTGNPEVVAPENIALAINQGCSGCETLAAAYQTVISTGGRVRMTGAGRATIGQLRRQLNTLRTKDLEFSALIAEIDRIAQEFAQVLRSEVVPLGAPTPSESAAPVSAEPTPEAAASTSPAETAAPAEQGTPTSEGSPSAPATSESAEPSPSPSP